MLRIGVTGGIGAGKSTLVQTFVEHGAYLIDSDQIAREVVAPGSLGLERITQVFGSHILTAQGTLDRKSLGEIIFSHPEHRQTVNSITHPLIAARTWELIECAPKDSIIIQDTPLLVELGMGALFNLVIVIDAPLEYRVSRLIEQRAMTREEALQRITAQTSTEKRKQAADIWINNDKDTSHLRCRALDIYYHHLIPYNQALITRTVVSSPATLSYHTQWSLRAQRIIARLYYLCADSAIKIDRIDHIGSTAIAYFPARDCIDIQITITEEAAIFDIIKCLEQGGYIYCREYADTNQAQRQPEFPLSALHLDNLVINHNQWKNHLFISADPIFEVHVYIQLKHTLSWYYALAFPQYLSQHPGEKAQYLQVKTQALMADNYALVKESYFESMYEKVMTWMVEHSLQW